MEQKKEEKMIDLREVAVPHLDGTVEKVDVSKQIANPMYFGAKDIAQTELARQIYATGKCQHTPENADAIRAVASSLYGYVVLSAIEQVLA